VEESAYLGILRRAARIAGAPLRDPDAANLFARPLFDDGTPGGRRIPVGKERMDEEILSRPEGSAARESAVRALGHHILEAIREEG
jgi:hypothetical protein